MPVLVLKSNPGVVTPVLIQDVGVTVPPGGQMTSFEELDALEELSQSKYLLKLAQDDAFGAGQSTLVLNNGVVERWFSR